MLLTEDANKLQHFVCETPQTDEDAAKLQPLERPCETPVDAGGRRRRRGDRRGLALVTGRRPPAHGARKEPHEPRSHATLVDNLTVTWEIQQQVSPLPGQPAARHTAEGKWTCSRSLQVLQDNAGKNRAAETGGTTFSTTLCSCGALQVCANG